MVKITDVEKNSPAEQNGIFPNDSLLSINGKEINDVLDYRFFLAEQEVSLQLKRENQLFSVSIVKEQYEDIGLCFETPLMDQKHRCENKCIFCFIDQLPKGLRETLYFKDDDSRLSFLHGNYVTLTNMEEKDIQRIIDMHISPVNISVHTTNPELRCTMMHNKRAGEVLSYLPKLVDGGIEICGQVVLCRHINDGKELEKTLHDLAKFYPKLRSCAVVPCGMTDYRDGLYPIEPFDTQSAKEVIAQVEKINAFYYKKFKKSLFFCSDEWYLTAKKKIPSNRYYEDYSQIENGVGMIRSFEEEVDSFLKTLSKEEKSVSRTVSVATGVLAYPMIKEQAKKIEKHCKNVTVFVYPILNDFFGRQITVSGLVTGVDLIKQLTGKELGQTLCIPRNMLRAEGDLFLCGTSLQEASEKLGVTIQTSQNGDEFVSTILEIKE